MNDQTGVSRHDTDIAIPQKCPKFPCIGNPRLQFHLGTAETPFLNSPTSVIPRRIFKTGMLYFSYGTIRHLWHGHFVDTNLLLFSSPYPSSSRTKIQEGIQLGCKKPGGTWYTQLCPPAVWDAPTKVYWCPQGLHSLSDIDSHYPRSLGKSMWKMRLRSGWLVVTPNY